MSEPAKDEADDRTVWLIASMLDHPSVFMDGPSQRNLRRARDIIDALRADGWKPWLAGQCWAKYIGPCPTSAEADALRAENARLREALAFYVRIRAQPVELVKDFGNTAEAALEWKP